ncbi:NAD(P)H-binding protein [Ramlibacter rhizophilus]|uniref:Nucleoside-diphosphate sugar epimerase n=1 Tax=Ramlibacter rhizophilus TaxID=1781167 RepID=A0A4Z0BDP2_9BURK|nr:NAD(P)H-binding protein [Ramlibacter rhizophilus]TFY96801.1 nucleoside-diphosphate sugar epimerase [Ramlibacter rhizophilus]
MNDDTNPRPPGGRRIALAGATGLVGQALLRGLLDEPSVASVLALVRRPLTVTHPKLELLVVDFAQLAPLPPVEEVYLALGTTIRVAGSQDAFRAVDFDANLAVARAARAAGARRLGLVSAMGADAHSRVFYNRVKGELEEAVAGLGFETVVVAGPSLLVGDRAALGQPARRGEHLFLRASRWLRPLVPANLRPIAAADVAAALRQRVPEAQGLVRLASGAMQGASIRR